MRVRVLLLEFMVHIQVSRLCAFRSISSPVISELRTHSAVHVVAVIKEGLK